MLLSGKLKPATVSVPLEAVGVPEPVLPHAVATKTRAAKAARNRPESNLGFIELFSFPPLGLPIQPQPNLDSSIYAVLKVAARRATRDWRSRIPRGTRSHSTPESDSSVAIASAATSTAPAANFV